MIWEGMFTTGRLEPGTRSKITCLRLGYIGGKRSPATRAATTKSKHLPPWNDSLITQKGSLWCVPFFDLKKEVFCVCPFLPKKGSSWWISFFLSHLFYVILVLSFLILITFLIYSALKNWLHYFGICISW